VVRVDSGERKDILSTQIKELRIFQTLLDWIAQEAAKELHRDEVIQRLQQYFPNEKLDQLFDTLVAFGRYAEILSYSSELGILSFPLPDSDSESVDESSAEA
jgi:NitT/TauT family transport system ATP-binding protein